MKTLFYIADAVIMSTMALMWALMYIVPRTWFLIPVFIPLFIIINIMPSTESFKYKKNVRLRVCADGTDLLDSFLLAAVITSGILLVAAFYFLPNRFLQYLASWLAAVAILAVPFWNGIIRVYITSVQLGLKHRLIGIICGLIPVANLVALISIISVCRAEVDFEYKKDLLNESRKDEQICKTKYPILLVHGVFFRDSRYINYWGRIPKELIRNGAVIYYGNHQSALSVKDSGAELAQRINQIVKETGCEKVNVIAHSKGGLDCRCAIANCGIADKVASLTTINTPHHGCLFADYLLKKAPDTVKMTVAATYNTALKRFGDTNPDFLSAVRDLTNENCEALNSTVNDNPDIYYQSVGSKLNRATNGTFPLNFTYHIAKHFSGPNDGLVSEESFKWGENYTYLTTTGRRGISHGDMVDLNRENIIGFDVREFYVQLVSGLKNRGL